MGKGSEAIDGEKMEPLRVSYPDDFRGETEQCGRDEGEERGRKEEATGKAEAEAAEHEQDSAGPSSCIDVKVAVVGDVDSGKTTLVGVLVGHRLDDGRGLMRSTIFNYSHEATSGRSSSVATEILGFTRDGREIIPSRHPSRSSQRLLSRTATPLAPSPHRPGSSSFPTVPPCSRASHGAHASGVDEKDAGGAQAGQREPSSGEFRHQEHGEVGPPFDASQVATADQGEDATSEDPPGTAPAPFTVESQTESNAKHLSTSPSPSPPSLFSSSSPCLSAASSFSSVAPPHAAARPAAGAPRNASWRSVVEEAAKIVTFLDLCGHARYLKTTIFGLAASFPHYAMVVIAGNSGLQRMTKEHLGIVLALRLPFFVVVTKIDMTPEHALKRTVESVFKVLKHPAVRKLPIMVKKREEVEALANCVASGRVCPVFCISNVTGEGLDLLPAFLSKLPNRIDVCGLFGRVDDPCEFVIDGVFSVPGVGLVVSGTLRSGEVTQNRQLFLGPDRTGTFCKVLVRSIHYKRVPVARAVRGQAVSMCIRATSRKDQLKRTSFRKGMVLLEPPLPLRACWEFLASVLLLHHNTTIQRGYQCVLHIGNVRQPARVTDIFSDDRTEKKDVLRTGDKGFVKFRFIQYAEYLTERAPLVFREGRMRGLGTVCEVC
ncbi:hypothetical protein NCLIV_010100 [Neospora caninum Liverpool]|uniref:GTP-binding protein, related n=1 Tax=Neospora caninum (strain Liverpool) TaxID=572307 RepID=F0VA52_NEOCL|nr:hypothetical protein NCLIV_010100 [Neospora caninum Liverpool]CBZ50541.1 hypothetical protein NCLIV_010100 [Neospora caninum Liverpool]CEL65151.1 TPA: GTP-binding protein, related [Neospora caninum Liverpool]|eukprot:XP_003880574.1 hypothetical protein NCLIV_010100 [Neospora caninum Liverpool]